MGLVTSGERNVEDRERSGGWRERRGGGQDNDDKKAIRTCGVIRPIAQTEGYSSTHWAEVGEILAESIKSVGYQPRLVSDADTVAVIHGTIVQNLFDDPIVVCDVSSRNPNVMFELGMRLAFDKPVVIVKDDATSYSFDTGLIEHLGYPKSLHYHEIRTFKEKLSAKLASTAEKAADTDYSPFLKHFRQISPKKLQNEDVTFDQFIVQKLEGIEARLNRFVHSPQAAYWDHVTSGRDRTSIRFEIPRSATEAAVSIVKSVAPNALTSYFGGVLTVEGSLSPSEVTAINNALTPLAIGAFFTTAKGKGRHGLSAGPADLSVSEPTGTAEVHKLPD